MKKMVSLVSILLLCSSGWAAEFVVEQKGKQFSPNTIKAKVGDTVRFKNSDPFAHNAYSDDAAIAFDIGMQAPGDDKVVKLKAKGKFSVGCNIHPAMALTIIVE
ncbi:MAG: cupredoxin domain-containing protein [Sulfuricurvum sp.]|jgi:plastocyanin|uniref:cupredoxin domain-containing protein n=1 Tax=Sulfuricurvum sp. TaxID=2025608 RepID=UPI0025DFFD2D|nr:plastocyanin/azurin family copper-binding protein [Sulfuricurvum sp.]MCK9373321.1 cupredoxin domain-containing protein [Sulfuricurvum sp.]